MVRFLNRDVTGHRAASVGIHPCSRTPFPSVQIILHGLDCADCGMVAMETLSEGMFEECVRCAGIMTSCPGPSPMQRPSLSAFLSLYLSISLYLFLSLCYFLYLCAPILFPLNRSGFFLSFGAFSDGPGSI